MNQGARWMKLAAVAGAIALVSACGAPNQFKLADRSVSFGQNIVYNTKVDMLWIVDNSSSMSQHQRALGDQLVGFIDALQASKLDFHIGVTTTDVGANGEKGAFVGSIKVLDRNTPSLKAQFIANATPGEGGSDLERGLSAIQMALDPAMLKGWNSGFFRSDALLAIVVLSDEDDQSAGDSKDFIKFLDGIKPPFSGGSRGWIANSIVVPQLDGNCKTFNQFSSPGYRYMDLSKASGGTVESICSADFTSAVKNIRARIIEILTEYHLGKEPDVSTIHVYVNGQELPQDPNNGWTYDLVGYTVKFHGSGVPPADAQVQIVFLPPAH